MKSIGLVFLMYATIVVVHMTYGIYNYIYVRTKEELDGVFSHMLFLLVPLRTLKKLLYLAAGFGLCYQLVHYFGIQGETLRLPRVMFLSVFMISGTYMFAAYNRVRAAICMIAMGMINHIAIFLLVITTLDTLLSAATGVSKNVAEMKNQVECISKIHQDLYRQSMLAYLAPVHRGESKYEKVMLVKERDMAMAQENMNLQGKFAMEEATGDRLGEQKKAAKENKKIDREYGVRRFANIKKMKKTTGSEKETSKLGKLFAYKELNLCQDLGTTLLRECRGLSYKFYWECTAQFPWWLYIPGLAVCAIMKIFVNCDHMYQNTRSKLDCKLDFDFKEVGESLLLVRDGHNVFYGDSGARDIREMYQKPVDIKYTQSKAPSEQTVLGRLDEITSCITILKYVFMFYMVVYSGNKVLSDMIKYDQSIHWENKYIGEYFRRIDRKRALLGFPRLIPFKASEKDIYVESLFEAPKNKEKEEVKLKRILIMCVQILTLIAFFLDYYLFTVTIYQQVSRNLTYTLSVDDYINIHAPGDSFLATLMNLLFEKINYEKKVLKQFRVDKCNPDVQFTNLDLYSRQQALILFLMILTFVIPVPDRLKHVVFRLFYPRRESKRQITMYKKILFTREKFVELAYKKMIYTRAFGKVTKLHDPQWQDLVLRQFRSISYIVGFFLKPTCSICKTSGGKSDYIICKGPACNYVYCRQCWTILGEKCLSCNLVITKELMERFATTGRNLFSET